MTQDVNATIHFLWLLAKAYSVNLEVCLLPISYHQKFSDKLQCECKTN